jgi:hypothetical protein
MAGGELDSRFARHLLILPTSAVRSSNFAEILRLAFCFFTDGSELRCEL